MQINTAFNVLYIANVANTSSFWKKIGAIIKQEEKDKVVVSVSDFDLHCVLESTEPFPEYQFATKNEGRGQGNLMYFGVDGIEDFYTKVKNAGPEKITPIKDNHWGGREFLFSDPDNYLYVAYQMNE